MRRPSRASAAICALLVAAGCDDAPPVPPRHPVHDLLIEGGVVRYNGSLLGPGVPVKQWTERLGPPSRTERSWLFWDSLALAVGNQLGDRSPGVPTCVKIAFRDAPGRSFPGRLLLDGAPLYPGVQLNHINQRTRLTCTQFPHGARFREDALPNTYSCVTSAPPREYALETYVDGRRTRARSLELCCPYDRGCR